MAKIERYLKTDMQVLRILSFENSLYPAEIARRLDLVPMTVLRLLRSLEKEGMVSVDTKGHMKLYTLTEKGRGLVAETLGVQPQPPAEMSFSPARDQTSARVHPIAHAAGICLRETGSTFEVLLAQRAKDERLFPGCFDSGGGTKQPWETWEESVKRHMYEDFGIFVNTRPFMPILDIQCGLPYDLSLKDGTKISGLALLCKPELYPHDQLVLDTEEYVADTLKWYDVDIIDGMYIIPDLKREIVGAVKLSMALEEAFKERFLAGKVTTKAPKKTEVTANQNEADNPE